MSASEDHATLMACIQGVDHAARRAERVWGMDRLPMLVSQDMRAKLFRQMAKWRHALEVAYAANPIPAPAMDAVKATSAGMERAWTALDAQARADGQAPIEADVWEARLKNGSVVALTRTAAEAGAVVVNGRYEAVYTLDEIASIIDMLPELLGAAQAQPEPILPGRTRIDRSWVEEGDALPW